MRANDHCYAEEQDAQQQVENVSSMLALCGCDNCRFTKCDIVPSYTYTLGTCSSAYPVQHAQMVPHRHQCVGRNCPACCYCRHANPRKCGVPTAQQAWQTEPHLKTLALFPVKASAHKLQNNADGYI